MFMGSEFDKCPLPWTQLVVEMQGVASPCCYGKWSQFFGNVTRQSMEEIWNGEEYQKLRKTMHEKGSKVACPQCTIRESQGLPKHTFENYEFATDKYNTNIDTLRSEYTSGVTVLAGKPTSLTISPSGKCNIRCVHCALISQGINKQEIGAQAWHLVETLTPYLNYLGWGGGEPLFLDEFKKYINHIEVATAAQTTLGLITNGLLLNETLLLQLSRFHSLNATISIDAGTAKVYESIRKPGKWSVLMGNVSACCRAREAGSNLWLTASYTISKLNALDVCNYINLCDRLHLPTCFFYVWHYPPSMRPDIFNDVFAETTGWLESFAQAEALAQAFDDKKYPECFFNGEQYLIAPFLRTYLEIIRAGIEKSSAYTMRNIPLDMSLEGKHVVAYTANGDTALAYGEVDAANGLRLRLPDRPVLLNVYDDIYVNNLVAQYDCSQDTAVRRSV